MNVGKYLLFTHLQICNIYGFFDIRLNNDSLPVRRGIFVGSLARRTERSTLIHSKCQQFQLDNWKLENFQLKKIYIFRLRKKAIFAQYRHIIHIFDLQFIQIKAVKRCLRYTHFFLTELSWCRIIKKIEFLFC